MSTSPKCPKCGFTANSSFKECPRCGVIISRFLQKAKGDRQAASRDTARKNSGLENLAQADTLIIRQQKEWGEILTGFETKNKYEVLDHFSNPLLEAQEEGGSALTTITRLFLKSLLMLLLPVYCPATGDIYQ